MGLSTKGRYGLRFMLDLAVQHDAGAVSLKDVARRQDISEKYLWQVLAPLKAEGLIVATRGSRGGYALARPPSAITVRDILTTLEGEDFPFGRTAEENTDRSDWAVVNDLWKQLEDNIAAAMAAVTLEDLVERHAARVSAGVPTYAI